jgi:hypothetical protein
MHKFIAKLQTIAIIKSIIMLAARAPPYSTQPHCSVMVFAAKKLISLKIASID